MEIINKNYIKDRPEIKGIHKMQILLIGFNICRWPKDIDMKIINKYKILNPKSIKEIENMLIK